MNKEKHTDRIIRNKLKYHASANPAHLWEAIDAQLTEDDQKRRGGFWWRTGGVMGVLLLSSLALLMWWSSQPVAEKPLSNVVFSTPEKVNPEESITNANNEIASLDENNSEAAEEDDDQTQHQQAIISTKKDEVVSLTVENTQEQVAGTSSQEEEIVSLATTDLEEAVVLQNETEKDQSIGFKIGKTSMLQAVDLPSQSLLIDQPDDEFKWPALVADPKCATFGKWLKLYFYGDFYFSPDYAFRTLESKGADYELYKMNREATESQLFSYSTGARFSIVSNYGVALRSGIVYSQINEVFKYENENDERIIIDNQYDDAGNLISSDTIIESGARYKTTYNHYRMIDVPILLGYEVNFKKFTLALNSGIYANLSSRQKGDFLSPEMELVTFSSDAETAYPAFRERLNLSLYGSLACLYNLNERWQIMLEPHFRYYLDPMTIPSYMIEQKYVTTGLITGLRYRF